MSGGGFFQGGPARSEETRAAYKRAEEQKKDLAEHFHRRTRLRGPEVSMQPWRLSLRWKGMQRELAVTAASIRPPGRRRNQKLAHAPGCSRAPLAASQPPLSLVPPGFLPLRRRVHLDSSHDDCKVISFGGGSFFVQAAPRSSSDQRGHAPSRESASRMMATTCDVYWIAQSSAPALFRRPSEEPRGARMK